MDWHYQTTNFTNLGIDHQKYMLPSQKKFYILRLTSSSIAFSPHCLTIYHSHHIKILHFPSPLPSLFVPNLSPSVLQFHPKVIFYNIHIHSAIRQKGDTIRLLVCIKDCTQHLFPVIYKSTILPFTPSRLMVPSKDTPLWNTSFRRSKSNSLTGFWNSLPSFTDNSRGRLI